MIVRQLAALAVLLIGAARADAQRRVVPAPSTPRRAHVVPRAKAPVVRAVPAPAREVPPAAATGPGSQLTVTLITFGVGEAVWERFGHNALWIHDAGSGQDVAYNWGVFAFDAPDFYKRFLVGDPRYWMEGEDAYAMISAYHNAGRPITLQTLNLTPAQALALRDFVERNALEENKYYRYDYFRDNCSTRLRDALDRVLTGALRRATDTIQTTLTYRGESVRLTEGDVPVQTGIEIALGRGADTPLTAWESFFIPMRLRDAARVVTIPGTDGARVPLVASERVMSPSSGTSRIVEPRSAPDHTRRNLFAGLAAAVVLLLFRSLPRSQRWATWIVGILGMVWSLLCGALGLVLLLAWVATKHVFWAQNENLLLLSPLSLLLVVLVPLALLAGRAVGRTRLVAGIVAGLGLLALALALLPGGQPNLDIVALFLPMHLALAAALFLYLPRQARAKRAPKG
ncbi:MAG: DUF4105 domain-containing protein [Gemmatimonadaceae bacterium]|nr:DUF4105 domain-containing protein [Gemmatimonadaceae bacterium]